MAKRKAGEAKSIKGVKGKVVSGDPLSTLAGIERSENFTHKRGAADTSGDKPGYPAGAHLDAPSAGEVQS